MRARVGMAALLAVVGCASRNIQTGPAAGAASTVHVWKVDLEDNSNSTVIYARNDGTSPVIISELRLYSCSNLYQNCGIHYPNMRVEPGQTVTVTRLDPSNHSQRPRFGWEYKWRGMAPTGAAPRVTTTGSFREVPLAQLVPLVPPIEEDPVCEAPPIPEEPGVRVLGMRFPRGISKRIIYFRLDSRGQVLQYHETRGDMRVPPPGVPARAELTDPGDRTSFTVDVANGVVLLTNQPAGAAPQQLMARGGIALLDAPSLGVPRNSIERIMATCGR